MKLIVSKTLSWYPWPSKGHSKYEWWWLNINILLLTKEMTNRLIGRSQHVR